MPEVPLDFPHAYVEFTDPADPEQLFRCDLTWLTSQWMCIYGRGCHGIDASKPDEGCCVLGAHFADKDDEARVLSYAERLTDADWQYRPLATQAKSLRKGFTEKDDDGVRKTRVVDGACIFLNRKGFAAGDGCALHALALREDISITQTKPDVCWQLPIRRTFDWTTRPDGEQICVVTIGEYDRRGWGPGGLDLDWYCTGDPEAHVSNTPVYVSEKDTLVELMGPKAYAILAEFCEARVATLVAAKRAMKSNSATSGSASSGAATSGKAAKPGSRGPVPVTIAAFAPHPADR